MYSHSPCPRFKLKLPEGLGLVISKERSLVSRYNCMATPVSLSGMELHEILRKSREND